MLISTLANSVLISQDASDLFAMAGDHIHKEEEAKAIPYLDQIIEKSKLSKDTTFLLYGYIYKAFCLFQLNDYKSMNQELDEAFDIAEKNISNLNPSIATDLYYLKSLVYINYGNQTVTEYYLEKARDYYEEFDKLDFNQSALYNNLGIVYIRNGDYNGAITQLDKAKLTHNKPAVSDIAQANALQAKALQHLGKYSEALTLYDKALSPLLSSLKPAEINSKLRIYEDLVSLGLDSDNLEMSKKYLNLLEQYELDQDAQIDYHKNLGHYHLALNLFDEAINEYETAISLCESLYDEKHTDIASIYFEIGKHLSNNDQVQEAEAFYDKAVDAISLNKLPTSNENFTNFEVIINHLLYHKILQEQIKNMIKAKKYDQFIDHINHAIELIYHIIEHNLITKSSQFKFREPLQNFFEDCIGFALQNEDVYGAYSIARRSKNIILQIDIMELHSKINFGLPDSLILKEKKLSIEYIRAVSDYLYQQNQEENAQSNSEIEKIENLKAERIELLKHIKNEYPQYYKLKHEDLFSAESYTNQKSEILTIEYFSGPKIIHAFLKSSDSTYHFSIPNDTLLQENIGNLRQTLQSVVPHSFDQFRVSSIFLYERLFARFKPYIARNAKHLYIIPDGILNYIPFEILLPESSNDIEQGRYDLLPYLIHDYTISYNYTSFDPYPFSNFSENKLTAFAPSFSSNESSLDSLLYNSSEVLMIDSIIDGKMHLSDFATLESFKKDIQEYQIAHLATHAYCSDQRPMESKIYFADNNLNAYDIYNYPTNLNLVVLSACETGTGFLQKGEGVMSLARAFISSGCKSVITTLWKTNDFESQTLMKYFYRNIVKGKSTGQSISLAKREFISNVNSKAHAHPYYWSSFVLVGQDDILFKAGIPKAYLLILSMLLLSTLIFIYVLKEKREVK